MLHIGGGGRSLKPAFHDNGRPVTDFLGGGENIRAKDYMAIHQSPEQFLSAMVLDGVLEDHPDLRGGCIEQGAMWVVPWLRRLDHRAGHLLEDRADAEGPAAEGIRLRPSPALLHAVPPEPVGWMIEECGDDLFLFSSDYPHPEGTKDPIERFESNRADMTEAQWDRFLRADYEDMVGLPA